MNGRGNAFARSAPLVWVLARWIVGALFIYMGMNKALHPVDFLKLVRQYDLIQTPFLLNSVAAVLPWFEVFCGILLVLGAAVRGSALVLIGMLVPFTAVVLHRALELKSALGIPFCAVRFDCGCGAGEINICRKLAENGILLALSIWFLLSRNRRLCWRHSIFKPLATGTGK